MEKKQRVKKGETYWFITSLLDVQQNWDWCTNIERNRFERGNYFNTKEEADAMVSKLRAVLKGADVIEMPSEDEIYQWVLDASWEFDQACENGCGELLSKGQRENIIETLNDVIREFLYPKIVK